MSRRTAARLLRGVPIRRKLTLIVMIVVSVALLLACAVFLGYEQVAAREALVDEMTTAAEIVGENSVAALSFGDPDSARQTLHTLRSYDDVVEAAIFDADGTIFAVYRRDEDRPFALPRVAADGHHFSSDALGVYGPIHRAGERAGTVYVKADLQEIRDRLRLSGVIVVIIMAGALLVALALSSALLTAVIGPIAHLAGVVRKVARDKNYAIRAAKRSDDELGALIDGFNEMLGQIQARDDALQEARGSLEARVEERTQSLQHEIAERIQVEEALREERGTLKSLVENVRAVPWVMHAASGACHYIGPQVERLWGWAPDDFAEDGFFASCVNEKDRAAFVDALERLPAAGELEIELRIRCRDGGDAHVRSLLSHGAGVAGGGRTVRGISIDVTAQRKLESELQQAQKLESVGRLAAGVAHEINTPVQYVNDNCHFLRDGVADLQGLLAGYRATLDAVAAGAMTPQAAVERMRASERDADVDYLVDNMPGAVERSLEGLERVTTIVRSMKEFAHPDRKEMTLADINHAIESTLTIARNEYKYVADVKTDFDELPPVPCFLGDLNQAVLNIVVNAAHAIEDVVRGSDRRGLITVRTRCHGDHVEIGISDTGGGIPDEVRKHIFDPFFTTKEVGKGTGQGLPIAHSVIVDKHKGSLRVETRLGEGSTFTICLPLRQAKAAVQD